LRGLVGFDQQAVDDGLATLVCGRLHGGWWLGKEVVNPLYHLGGGHGLLSVIGKQLASLTPTGLEKGSRASKVVAAAEPARHKPGVPRGMTARAIMPVGEVEIASGHIGENPLELLKGFDVMAYLPRPPAPFCCFGQSSE